MRKIVSFTLFSAEKKIKKDIFPGACLKKNIQKCFLLFLVEVPS